MNTRRRARRDADELQFVVQVWLATRLLFLVAGAWVMVTTGRTFEQVVGNWDVGHFVAIARDGYADPQRMAFFPGLPALLRGGLELGVSPHVTGMLLAAGGSLAAAFALHRLGGVWAATAWLLAPTGVFTVVPYTESLFAAFAFWAWERATRDRWGAAAVLAAFACTLRVSGLFLVGALAVLALTRGVRGLGGRWLWLLIPLAVLLAYVGYLYHLTGTWTAWYSAQASGWQRTLTAPWDSFAHSWDAVQPGAHPEHPEWVWVFRAEMVSMAVGVVVTVVALARRRVAEAAWVGVQVLAFSLSWWFMSVTRSVLLWFPLWTQLGAVADRLERSRPGVAVLVVAAVVAVAVQLAWAWLFFTGRWAS